MAASDGTFGFSSEGELATNISSYHAYNGDANESISLGTTASQSGLPSMEDMLQAATDLQNDTRELGSIGGRLELKDDNDYYHNQGGAVNGHSESQGPFYSQEQNSYGYSSNQQYGSGPEGQTTLVKSDATTAAKLESIKKWTVATYKCTRQLVSEKLGRRTRTVDEEVEKHIENLRDTQRKYANLLKLSKQLTQQFQNMLVTQKGLLESFSDLTLKSPELQEEFNQNADLQKVLVKNGESLLTALAFFTSSLATLCNKTIEDTIMTVKAYEGARIEYDAYRTDLEAYQSAGISSRTEDARRQYESQKEKFDKLRQDLQIKLKFLEENKVKVMRKQLLLFHNAVAAYFSGNQKELENIIKEFHIRTTSKGEGTSFLEH